MSLLHRHPRRQIYTTPITINVYEEKNVRGILRRTPECMYSGYAQVRDGVATKAEGESYTEIGTRVTVDIPEIVKNIHQTMELRLPDGRVFEIVSIQYDMDMATRVIGEATER